MPWAPVPCSRICVQSQCLGLFSANLWYGNRSVPALRGALNAQRTRIGDYLALCLTVYRVFNGTSFDGDRGPVGATHHHSHSCAWFSSRHPVARFSRGRSFNIGGPYWTYGRLVYPRRAGGLVSSNGCARYRNAATLIAGAC